MVAGVDGDLQQSLYSALLLLIICSSVNTSAQLSPNLRSRFTHSTFYAAMKRVPIIVIYKAVVPYSRSSTQSQRGGRSLQRRTDRELKRSYAVESVSGFIEATIPASVNLSRTLMRHDSLLYCKTIDTVYYFVCYFHV